MANWACGNDPKTCLEYQKRKGTSTVSFPYDEEHRINELANLERDRQLKMRLDQECRIKEERKAEERRRQQLEHERQRTEAERERSRQNALARARSVAEARNQPHYVDPFGWQSDRAKAEKEYYSSSSSSAGASGKNIYRNWN